MMIFREMADAIQNPLGRLRSCDGLRDRMGPRRTAMVTIVEFSVEIPVGISESVF